MFKIFKMSFGNILLFIYGLSQLNYYFYNWYSLPFNDRSSIYFGFPLSGVRLTPFRY